MCSDNKHGFTLIELLVVISIIGLLASVTMASLTQARLSAQYTKARADIRALANLADFAKGTQNRTLLEITGSFCSECACRNNFQLPVTVSLHDRDPNSTCYTHYFAWVALLNQNTNGLYTIPNPPLDPWGAPYLLNENEGEVQNGVSCFTDNITSAGPNGLYYDTDDVTYNLPATKCENPVAHQPNTNWN